MKIGRLKIAQTILDTCSLVDELLVFRVKITPSANDTYEAWQDDDHDNLVFAVALAAWYSLVLRVFQSIGQKIPKA